MSNPNDQQPAKKSSKANLKRRLYDRLGVQHPKDKALDIALMNFRNMMEKSRVKRDSRANDSPPTD